MRNALFLTAVILFAVAIALACTSVPAAGPSPTSISSAPVAGNNAAPRPAAAAGGSAFSSPIETPPSPIATPPPGSTATPGEPTSPVEISLALAGPAVVGQPVTLNVTLRAREEILGPRFGLVLQDQGGQQLQVYTATLPALAANESRQLSYALHIPSKDGYYMIAAYLNDDTGGSYHQPLYVDVKGETVVVNAPPPPSDAPVTVEILGTRGYYATPTPRGTAILQPTTSPIAPAIGNPSGHMPTEYCAGC